MKITLKKLLETVKAQTDVGFLTSVFFATFEALPTAYADMILTELYLKYIHKGPYWTVTIPGGDILYFFLRKDCAEYVFSHGGEMILTKPTNGMRIKQHK